MFMLADNSLILEAAGTLHTGSGQKPGQVVCHLLSGNQSSGQQGINGRQSRLAGSVVVWVLIIDY